MQSAVDLALPGGAARLARHRGPASKPKARGAGCPRRAPRRGAAAGLTGRYPGDFHGKAKVSYAPSPNGRPEPGEIVWTWVPYEEDYSQGKDRPVLLVGNQRPLPARHSC